MIKIYFLALVLLLCNSCRDYDYIDAMLAQESYDNDGEAYNPDQVDLVNYPDWTANTHGNGVDANFDEVFPSTATVKRIDLTISSSNWSKMWSDLKSNYRYITSSGSDYTPVWVNCTLSYNDKDWYQVGVRFKGNSSLQTAYISGSEKLSLKLDMDQYEDSYPALTNQRFYGFKQLNLNNNYDDNSLMREKVCSDLFRDFGVASANTCFCSVYINGSCYGVYTIVEEVDDTVIDYQFSDGSGNLYKPDDNAGSFKKDTYNTSEFYLKTNTSSPNYNDVASLYNALHGSNRTSNPTAWCETLEQAIDIEVFLKWLAANIVIQNWDTYGNMAHNYYLYNNPSTNLLTWIPWDNNEALQAGTGEKEPLSYRSLSSVGSSWPLIYYVILMSDYEQKYKDYMKEFITTVFTSDKMTATYTEYQSLLQSYVSLDSEVTSSQFSSAVSALKTHASSRVSTISNSSYVN